MRLSFVAALYFKARVMSWLMTNEQAVYITAITQYGRYQTELATFRNGRLVTEHAPPKSPVPDHFPEEWVPKPPDNPDKNN